MIEYEKFFKYSLDLFVIAGMDGYFKRANPAFCNLLKYTEGELLSRPFIDFVHPEDIYKVEGILKNLSLGHPAFLVEVRLVAKDGTHRLLSWTGYPDLDSGLIFAIGKDQTLQNQGPQDMRSLLDSSPTAVFLVEQNGMITYANHLAEFIFGYEKNELIGAPIEVLVPERYRGKHTGHRGKYIKEPKLRPMGTVGNLAGRKKNGQEFPIEIGLNPVWFESGMITICSVIDASPKSVYVNNLIQERESLKQTKIRLERLADRDTLTGLLNRRGFERIFGRDLSAARKSGAPISIISLDIDHFKQYNDRFGHPAGDALLKKFGSILNGNIRRGDAVARIGGDEFIIILPNNGCEQAVNFGKRLHKIIRSHVNFSRHATVSMGASTYTFHSSRANLVRILNQIVTEADKALYHSKNSGRGRFTHYSDISRKANGESRANSKRQIKVEEPP